MNHYQVLGVSEQATPEEIRKAYRQLVLKYHPDRNAGSTAFVDRFQQVQKAYEVLGDAQAKFAYDATIVRQQYRKPTVETPIYDTLTIVNFSADPPFIRDGQTVTFFWEVQQADSIELKPFGRVDTPKGSMTLQINAARKQWVIVELVAFSAKEQRTVHQEITLPNFSYRRANVPKDSRNWGYVRHPLMFRRRHQLQVSLLLLMILGLGLLRQVTLLGSEYRFWVVLLLYAVFFGCLAWYRRRKPTARFTLLEVIVFMIPIVNIVFLGYMYYKEEATVKNKKK